MKNSPTSGYLRTNKMLGICIKVCPVTAVNESAFATCLTPESVFLILCFLTTTPNGLGQSCKQKLHNSNVQY